MIKLIPDFDCELMSFEGEVEHGTQVHTHKFTHLLMNYR